MDTRETVGDILIKQLKKIGADGIIDNNGCGCGEKHGYFLMESCNLFECYPAKWEYCRYCECNGKCDMQIEWQINGEGREDGCYRIIKNTQKR